MKQIIIIINVILVLLLLFLNYFIFHDHKEEELVSILRKMETVVEIPYSLAENFEKSYRANPSYKQSRIQEEFININNQLRYDNNDFFFILNGSGIIVSHPLRPSLLWWNLLNETDDSGNYFFKKLLIDAKKNGEAYVETVWESKNNNQEMEEQIIYGKYFWPWDWIICTTYYKNDVESETNSLRFYVFYTIVLLILVSDFVIITLLRRLSDKNTENKSK